MEYSWSREVPYKDFLWGIVTDAAPVEVLPLHHRTDMEMTFCHTFPQTFFQGNLEHFRQETQKDLYILNFKKSISVGKTGKEVEFCTIYRTDFFVSRQYQITTEIKKSSSNLVWRENSAKK